MGNDRIQWTEDQRFERDGLCVTVRKLPLRYPRYALTVDSLTAVGARLARLIPLRASGKGRIVLDRVSNMLAEVLADAEDYVQSELQLAEDARIEECQHYEERDMNRDKPKPKVGLSGGPGSGKTARVRANRQCKTGGKP